MGNCRQYPYIFADIIKKYNPNVTGYSTGVIPALTQDLFPDQCRYNMAVSGAKAEYVLLQSPA